MKPEPTGIAAELLSSANLFLQWSHAVGCRHVCKHFSFSSWRTTHKRIMRHRRACDYTAFSYSNDWNRLSSQNVMNLLFFSVASERVDEKREENKKLRTEYERCATWNHSNEKKESGKVFAFFPCEEEILRLKVRRIMNLIRSRIKKVHEEDVST